MLSAEFFFTIFLLIPPVLGSSVLSVSYFTNLRKIGNNLIWAPIIIGFLTPLILLLFRIDFYIHGYIAWIGFAIVFWIGWKKSAKKLAGLKGISLDIIGIGEKSTTEADSRGAVEYGMSGISRASALIGLLFLYPLLSAILNIYLGVAIRNEV